ncbi:glycine cleavage H-protein-domain-containing protein [Scleroderma yunnanense]
MMFAAIRSAARTGVSFSIAARARPSPLVAQRLLPSYRTIVTTRYTKEHEAITFDDVTGVGIVSITEHAQESLGDVVFVELPVKGTKVAKGDQIGAVESVKAASDIYAPVSGEVLEVNEDLHEQPSLLNKTPEGEGWLCKIKLSEPSEMETLLTEEGYKEECES